MEARRLLSFSPALDHPVGLGPSGTLTTDFNLDGHVDLAVANGDDNTVSVLLGDGDGTFRPARTSVAGNRPASIHAGDFNGDGKADLVTVNIHDSYASAGDLSVLVGNGDGSFQAPRTVALPAQTPPAYTGSPLAQTPRSAAVRDLDADGRLDMVVGGYTYYYFEVGYDWDTQSPIYDYRSDGYVNVLLGNGDGTFGPGAAAHLGGSIQTTTPKNLAVADFNGDGALDVATDASGLTTLLGNGDGTLRAPRRSAAYGSFALSGGSLPVADFDGDGKLDLLMRDGTGNAIIVMPGNGDGTFRETGGVFVDGIHSAAVGDVNADGMPDVVVLNGSYTDENQLDWASSARVLLGRGDGTFDAPTVSDLATPPGNFRTAVLADFDADGSPDLAVAVSRSGYDDYGYYYGDPGFVAVAHNDGAIVADQPPSIGSLSAGAQPVTHPRVITLTAGGVADPGGAVATVAFFREANGVAGLQVGPGDGSDASLGLGSADGGGSWSVTVGVAGWPPGRHTFYALATDDRGSVSAVGAAALSAGNQVVGPGDANADGRVDAADYHRIDRGRALGLAGWANGDFDGSGGPPDADDYVIADREFLAQQAQALAARSGAPAPLPGAAATDDATTAAASVPVPAPAVPPAMFGAQTIGPAEGDAPEVEPLWGEQPNLLA